MSKSRFMSIICLFLSVSSLPVPSWAQSVQGAVSITVTDPAGAVIPGAVLELKAVATNDLRTAQTQEIGIYRFVGLNIGSYSLTVTKVGFNRALVDSVIVEGFGFKSASQGMGAGQSSPIAAPSISSCVSNQPEKPSLKARCKRGPPASVSADSRRASVSSKSSGMRCGFTNRCPVT